MQFWQVFRRPGCRQLANASRLDIPGTVILTFTVFSQKRLPKCISKSFDMGRVAMDDGLGVRYQHKRRTVFCDVFHLPLEVRARKGDGRQESKRMRLA